MSQFELITLILTFIFLSPAFFLGVICISLDELNLIIRTIDEIKGKTK